ncbi:MAG: acetolactate synthase small subunit [Oscillospiraceae bacterium]|nr:acetolactate synthase small subunit [Oscillospiraceae bacterium]MDD4413140.1 acetolactate synthase small subunit [Oscillospiraceae bacterium]
MGDGKAIFSVLAVNHPGVLLRVSGLFSRRGFNIDSIVACSTEKPAFSRLTIVVTGDEATFTQLTRQLLKLEDIIKVEVLEPDECSNSELLLVKVHAVGTGRGPVIKMVQTYGARVLDIGELSITVEMTGQTEETDEFVEQLERFGVLEMARTGINALQRGDLTIHDED